MHYIYKTTNLINGKEYIGRRSTMKKDDSKYLGSGKGLKRAIKKYGTDNFIKQILFYADSFEEVCRYEKIIVNDKYVARKDTYNMILGGVGVGMKGYNHTEETKTKMSKAKTGVKRSEFTDETKLKMSESSKGIMHTEETKAKISENHSRHMSGKTHLEETKAKISEARKNAPKSECLYCGKVMDVANVERWHNNNCKLFIMSDLEATMDEDVDEEIATEDNAETDENTYNKEDSE